MPSLDDHFRALTKIRTPEDWPDLEALKPRPLGSPPETSPEPRSHRRRVRSAPGQRHRVAAAALAFAIAVAGIGFAIWTFGGASQSPQPRPAAAVEDGKIAFVTGDFPAYEIYTLNPDGSDMSKLGDGRDPAWSPDGSRLAFTINAPGLGIALMNADGTDRTELTHDVAYAQSPSWSPDGTKIAFAAQDGIYVMSADGTDIHRVGRYTGPLACADFEPSWSPDGTTIAWAVLCDGGGLGIWTVRSDGSGLSTVVDERSGLSAFNYPTWSPDGTLLAFEGGRPVYGEAPGPILEMGIYVVGADGNGLTKLAEGTQPAWSPDGTKIAFLRDLDLVVMSEDGSQVTQVTSGRLASLGPAWQPVPVEGGSPSPSPSASVPPPTTPSVSTVALPDGLGATRVAIGEGAVWALASTGKAGSSVLVRIDPATDHVIAMTPLEAEPWYVAAGGGAVWVGSPRSSTIQRVDGATNEVTGQIQLPGDGVGAIAADEQAVWVQVIQDRSDQGQQNLASLVRIDPQTSEVVATIPLEGLSGYDDEIAIGAGAVWVAGVNLTGPSEERGANLVRIDPTTNTITAVLPVSAFSVRAGADAVWVTSPADGVNDSVHKPESWVAREIDPMTNEVLAPLPLPGNVSGVLAVTAEGVWFSGYDDQGLIHPVRLQAAAFDASVPPIDSVYTDVAFDDASGSIWVATIVGLKLIDAA
jgi:TolB protein